MADAPIIRLSALEQRTLWHAFLAAKMRAYYFADLCGRYKHEQTVASWAMLVLSSGAMFTALTSVSAAWVLPLLTIATTSLSGWSLLANKPQRGLECGDLHLRWTKLANAYLALWNNMYVGDARQQLAQLQEQEAEIGHACTSLPNNTRLLRKWQRYVVQQHQPTAA